MMNSLYSNIAGEVLKVSFVSPPKYARSFHTIDRTFSPLQLVQFHLFIGYCIHEPLTQDLRPQFIEWNGALHLSSGAACGSCPQDSIQNGCRRLCPEMMRLRCYLECECMSTTVVPYLGELCPFSNYKIPVNLPGSWGKLIL